MRYFRSVDNEIYAYDEDQTPLDRLIEISKEEADSILAEKKQEKLNSLSYIDLRKLEYPSVGDQLDMIYHAGLGGDEFQAAITAVKSKYPKVGA